MRSSHSFHRLWNPFDYCRQKNVSSKASLLFGLFSLSVCLCLTMCWHNRVIPNCIVTEDIFFSSSLFWRNIFERIRRERERERLVIDVSDNILLDDFSPLLFIFVLLFKCKKSYQKYIDSKHALLWKHNSFSLVFYFWLVLMLTTYYWADSPIAGSFLFLRPTLESEVMSDSFASVMALMLCCYVFLVSRRSSGHYFRIGFIFLVFPRLTTSELFYRLFWCYSLLIKHSFLLLLDWGLGLR